MKKIIERVYKVRPVRIRKISDRTYVINRFLQVALLLAVLPSMAYSAASSPAYQTTGDTFAPAVGAAASSSYSATSVLVSLPVGAPASTNYKAVIGSPSLFTTTSSSSSPSGGSTGASGGGGGGAAPQLPSSMPPSEGDRAANDANASTVYNVQVLFITPSEATVTFDTYDPAITAVNYAAEGTQKVLSTPPSKQSAYAHTHIIKGLKPGSAYLYSLFVQRSDKSITINQHPSYKFTTATVSKSDQAQEKISERITITSFVANRGEDNNAYLSWKFPDTDDVASVQVYRSVTNFPLAPDEGVLVYSGNDDSHTDKLSERTAYYYTLFPVYKDGTRGTGIPARATSLEQIKEQPRELTPEVKEPLAKALPASQSAIWWWMFGFGLLITIMIFFFLFKKRREEEV